jgi:hypothetical protein
MEVYLIFKTLGKEKYCSNHAECYAAHWIVIFKTEDGEFYYTDLSPTDEGANGGKSGGFGGSTGKGKIIKIRFGKYTFYPNQDIYHVSFGRTNKSLEEIKKFAEESPFNDQNYSIPLGKCCTDYAESCLRWLNIEGKGCSLRSVKNSSELNLKPAANLFGLLDRIFTWNWK